MDTITIRKRLALVLGVLGLTLFTSSRVWAQAFLENPRPLSFQSGIGVISGWVCNASRVDIEFDGAATLQAAYGTSREDTRLENGGLCDDADNGFGLLFNWNLLGDGVHTVRALADGVEFAKAAVVVTTLGRGEFVPGLNGTIQVPDFPRAGVSTQVQWQEAQQNFLIASGSAGGGGGNTGNLALLENPQPASFQSGIGVISGWVCNASRVDIEFDGAATLQAAYGTSREDTRLENGGLCDDADNGFGLLFNWNLLGDGVHTVRALADGVEFANVMFTVTTLGLGEFARGVNGSAQVANFPQVGTGMRLQWQESQQNFPLAGALPPGVSVTEQCTSQQGSATDSSGNTATSVWTNFCLLLGNAIQGRFQVPQAGALSGEIDTSLRSQSTDGFFLCGEDLSFVQGDRVLRSTDFELLDAEGNQICDLLPPGSSIDVLIRLLGGAGTGINFNEPFTIQYENQSVVSFPPAPDPQCTLQVSPSALNFGEVEVGQSGDASFRVTNNGPGTLTGTATIDTGDFRIVSGGQLNNLGPGQSRSITVRFSPTGVGTRTGNARVDSNCGSALVGLSGVGTERRPPQLAVTPNRLDFGSIPRGQSGTRNVTVTNNGGGTLEGQIVLNLEGGISGTVGSFTLGSGNSQVFPVTINISPTDVGGPFSGTVNVTSNGGSAQIPVSGTVQ